MAGGRTTSAGRTTIGRSDEHAALALTLLRPVRVLPVLEFVLLVVLVASNPRRVEPRTRWLRRLGLALIGVISLANGWSAGCSCRTS